MCSSQKFLTCLSKFGRNKGICSWYLYPHIWRVYRSPRHNTRSIFPAPGTEALPLGSPPLPGRRLNYSLITSVYIIAQSSNQPDGRVERCLSRDNSCDSLGGVEKAHFISFLGEAVFNRLVFCEKGVNIPVTHLLLIGLSASISSKFW